MSETNNRTEILQLLLEKIDEIKDQMRENDYKRIVDVFQEVYNDDYESSSESELDKSEFFRSLMQQIKNRDDLTETETTQLIRVIDIIGRLGVFDETPLVDHNFTWGGKINLTTFYINSYKAKENIVFKVNDVINVLMAFQNEIARLKKLMSGDKLISMYQKNETKLKEDNDKLRKIIRSLTDSI